jgi:class 3 adenylate cyclase
MKIKSILTLYKENNLELESTSSLVLDYLNSLAIIEDDTIQKKLLKEVIQKYVILEKKVDSLLKNTLPAKVAEEIKYEGWFTPRSYNCTILFSDFVGFTRLSERISGEVLIGILDKLFSAFDKITARFKGTKIKTIGDSYMAVFGAPDEFEEHAVMAVRAGLALLKVIETFNGESDKEFHIRIGIHTGKVMAGVVGEERMQFDVFGDNVNTASRLESSGETGKINISEETYLQTRNFFKFEERGKISLKNKDSMKAYFVIKEL